jgi:hypothetical protein
MAFAALVASLASAHAAPRAVVAAEPRAVVAAEPRAVVVAKPRAVVELFTSPFCGACPPADALFVELARNPDLITLVMPVDSWDRPGRKDALAKPSFTERQAGYAEARNTDVLYTPQAVINGAVDATGSDQDEIDYAISQTSSVLNVPIQAVAKGGEIVVTVGAASGTRSKATITVLPFIAKRSIPMRGGETLTYANLVRDILPVGRWSGKAVRHTLALAQLAQCDGVVVLLQAGTPEQPGAIIGATRLSIRSGNS